MFFFFLLSTHLNPDLYSKDWKLFEGRNNVQFFLFLSMNGTVVLKATPYMCSINIKATELNTVLVIY